MHPIEKQRSEMQWKMSQIEQKFNNERGAETSGPIRRVREHVDQNRAYDHPIAFSKTMEVKARTRGAGEIAKVKQNIPLEAQGSQALVEIRMRNVMEREAKEEKDDKIKTLEHMVKSLLEGQKVLEKELTELKTKQTREEVHKSKLIEQQYSQFQPPLSFAPSSEKPVGRPDKEQSACKRRSNTNAMNHSLLIAESSASKASKQKRKPKKPLSQLCKKKDFEELYQQLKERQREEKRYLVEQEWKSRVWSEVESRVRQSDKEYKDTMHRNNKHEFEHLMSTFELQRKLKDDLVAKAYQQCNDQLYK